MNIEKIIKETKVIMIGMMVMGLILLLTGISFDLLDNHIIRNNWAIVGLSFKPVSVALAYYLKLIRIKKSPQKMGENIVSRND